MLYRTSILLWFFLLLLPSSFLSAQQNTKNVVPAASASLRSGKVVTITPARNVNADIKKGTLESFSFARFDQSQQPRLFVSRPQPVSAVSLPVNGAYFSINSVLFDTLAPVLNTTFLVPGFSLGSDVAAYTLELERFNVLTPGFSAVTGTEEGDIPFSPDKHLLFAGRVREIPGSYVYIAVFRSYCYGYIELSRPQDTTTHRYIIAPVSSNEVSPVMVVSDEHDPHEREPEHVLCSTDETEHTIGSSLRRDFPAGKRGTEKPKTTVTLTAGVAIDCDYEYYQDHGSNISRATNYALAVIGASSAIYYRDVNIRLLVPYLRIWTSSDPYTGTNTSTLLTQFRNYWNTNMTSVRRVLAHLFSGVNGIGGIAFVDVLCNDGFGYGVSGLNNNVTFPASGYVWDVDVTTHEMGHNFGSPHTHSCTWAPAIDSCYDAEGSCFSSRVYRVGSIMSYCHLSSGKYLAFHPRVTTLIRSKAENAICIPAGVVTAINDVAVISITEPAAGAIIATSASFSPTVVFRNNGSANQTTLTVTCQITDTAGNQVYSSTQTISSLSSGASSTATFSPVTLPSVNNYLVRSTIALSNDSYTYDNSMVRPFSITSAVSGSVTVTAPNTSATMAAGGTYTITWTKNIVTNVLIEFSANNGITWRTVHSNHTGTSYVWTVPGIATTQGRIRISDRSNSATSDISDASFTITLNNDIQPIEFVTPTEGGSATAPFVPRVAFRNNGISTQTNVPVRLRAVNVTTNREIYNAMSTIASMTAGEIDTVAFAQFTTSASGTYMCYVRALLSEDQNTSNDSLTRASSVTIIPPTLTMTSPNGGERWQAGTVQSITWTSTGFLAAVSVEYSVNNGSSWTTIVSSTSNTGSFLWTIPNLSTSQARVRISDASNTALTDMSNAVFAINALQPPSALTASSGNNQIVLRWQTSGSSGVTGYKIYRGTTAQSSSPYATVSAQVNVFTDTDVVNCTSYYYSASTLINLVESVQATQATVTTGTNATLTLLAPNGGEKWQAGLSKIISWNTVGCVPSIAIEYSTNNGVVWTTITSAVVNTGSYAWTVSNSPVTQALIRIRKVSDMSVSDMGNASFVIGAIASPSIVQVTFANLSTVVTWSQSTSAGVTGYTIYRKTGTGDFVLIGTTSSVVTTYNDAATTSNTLYMYAISASVNTAVSALSKPVEFCYLLPVITASGPTTFCAGGSVTLDAGSGYSSYLWSNGATTQRVTVSQSGTYQVTVANVAGYSARTQMSITVLSRSNLAISKSGPTTFCAGGSVTLDAGVGYTSYLWSNGATTQTLVVAQSGNYTVTAINVSGCSATSTQTVSVRPKPNLVISKSGPTTFCVGSSVVLDAGSGYSSYLWSNGATSQTLSVTQSGNYTVMVVNAGGCSAMSTQTVTVLPRPTLAISANGPTVFCTGGSVVLDASSGYSSYLWSNGATTQTLSVTQSGSYSVSVVNAGGCSATSTQSVTVLPQPSVAISANGPTAFCAGGSVVLDAGSGYSSYLWSNGATSQTLSVTQSGSYSVAVVNASGCSATSMQSVTVYDQLPVTIDGAVNVCALSDILYTANSFAVSLNWSVTGGTIMSSTTGTSIIVNWGNGTSGSIFLTAVSAQGCVTSISKHIVINNMLMPEIHADGPTTFCEGDSVTLNAGSGYASYLWSNGATTQTITVTQSGTYGVVVAATGGCTGTNSTVVTVLPRPTATISANGPTTFCEGDNVTLDAGAGYSSYLWSNGATVQAITVNQSGVYSVRVTNESGCSSESSAVPVVVTPAVVISAGTDTTMCVGGSVQLSASGGTTYTWQPSTGLDNPFIANPVASPMVTTTYIVTAISVGGCSSSDTIVVTVKPLTASIAVFLQGAYSSGNIMNTQLQMQNLVPLQQPYNKTPFNYDGTEQLDVVPDGIVDWVLVEFRSATNASVVVARRAALLRDNGTVVDVDGVSPLSIPSLSAGSYYIVVRHRTHLAVMSASPVLLAPDCSLSHSFTSSQGQAYSTFDEPMIYLAPSLYGLVTGDQSADGIIGAPDRVGVRNSSGQTGYISADIIMDGLVNAMDRVVARNNTFRAEQLP